MKAQKLRDLVEDDDHADSRFEADEHRLGNEVRDETEPEEPGHDQDRPDEQGQGGRSAQSCAAESPAGTASPSAAAVRIAIVVVELTERTRDVPSAA